jgi:hypothetical protein
MRAYVEAKRAALYLRPTLSGRALCGGGTGDCHVARYIAPLSTSNSGGPQHLTSWFCPREKDLIEGGGKAGDTESTFVPYVIDKESRRTIHAASYVTNEIALYFIGVGA